MSHLRHGKLQKNVVSLVSGPRLCDKFAGPTCLLYPITLFKILPIFPETLRSTQLISWIFKCVNICTKLPYICTKRKSKGYADHGCLGLPATATSPQIARERCILYAWGDAGAWPCHSCCPHIGHYYRYCVDLDLPTHH